MRNPKIDLNEIKLTEKQIHVFDKFKALYKSKMQFARQNQATNEFFDFNIKQKSHTNLKELKEKLGELVREEKNIFIELINFFSIKHASRYLDQILMKGKMFSSHELTANENEEIKRHTRRGKGVDFPLYFVLGVGNHATPDFLQSHTTYVITVNLNKLHQNDPLAMERMYVSNHLDEYQVKSSYAKRLGDVDFIVKHHPNLIKTYRFIYKTGEIFDWDLSYQDEIYSGKNIAPAMALTFIYMLRLLGGNNNTSNKSIKIVSATWPTIL